MKIAIVGYGREGQSSYKYFSENNEVTICDLNTNIEVPADAKSQLGQGYLDNLKGFDVIVRSAGINPKLILDKNPDVKEKITSQLNEFLRVCPSKNIIGVTGTKGKGTTSTLIYEILKAAGKNVVLAGNIGIPFLNVVKDIKEASYVVLELSSFQLIDLKEKASHFTVCLTVVPDHLDWHSTKEEYFGAKANLFSHQSSEDIAIYYSANETSKAIASSSPGKIIPYFDSPGAVIINGTVEIDGHKICRTDELKLLGKHNWQNVCAAVTAAWQVTQDVASISTAVTSFKGLAHRIEFVRELNGVKYYNDSFASGLGATQAAIEAIPGKKVMIIGGYEKNLDIEDFGYFALENSEHFRTILLIGASADKVKSLLDKVGFTNYIVGNDLKTMSDIVKRAHDLAHAGDSIVLSPGFASFDMFKNVEDRGNQFKEAVMKL